MLRRLETCINFLTATGGSFIARLGDEVGEMTLAAYCADDLLMGEREVACKARARGYCPGLPGPMIMSTWSAPEFSYTPAVYHVV